MGTPSDSDDVLKIILELSKVSSQGLHDIWIVKCLMKSWQNQNCLSLDFSWRQRILDCSAEWEPNPEVDLASIVHRKMNSTFL